MKADSGTVAFKEKNLIAADSKNRQNIFYIGHDPGLYSFFSPRENLRFLLSLRSLTSKEKYIEEKLDRYGLIDFIDKPIAVFSRGMLQWPIFFEMVVCRSLRLCRRSLKNKGKVEIIKTKIRKCKYVLHFLSFVF